MRTFSETKQQFAAHRGLSVDDLPDIDPDDFQPTDEAYQALIKQLEEIPEHAVAFTALLALRVNVKPTVFYNTVLNPGKR